MRPNKAETAVYGCHDTYGDSHTTGLGRTCVPLAFKVFVCNLVRYRNRNGLHANLRPFSLRDFICNTFFFGIRNAWFTKFKNTREVLREEARAMPLTDA